MAQKPQPARLAWAMFDQILEDSSSSMRRGPWRMTPSGELRYDADFEVLSKLLGVPIFMGSVSQSGLLALAVDVWVAFELRRAGFDEDAVWPRAAEPRVLPRALSRFVGELPQSLRETVVERFDRSKGGTSESSAAPASAKILGKNYVKQVDVVISDWSTGPELLISTKRMDSSYSSNALNRVEESYGDAKNLRLRHPLAALGFVFVLSSGIYNKNSALVPRIKDLLAKLGQEDDAYHAVMLVMPNYENAKVDAPTDIFELEREMKSNLASVLRRVPQVEILLGEAPPEIAPSAFFETMIQRVLHQTPVDFHQNARLILAEGLKTQAPL